MLGPSAAAGQALKFSRAQRSRIPWPSLHTMSDSNSSIDSSFISVGTDHRPCVYRWLQLVTRPRLVCLVVQLAEYARMAGISSTGIVAYVTSVVSASRGIA